MTAKRTQILDSEAIAQKVRRMAYEIVEDCYEDKELVLVGIEPNGYEFARLLKSEIEKIQGQTVVLHSLAIEGTAGCAGRKNFFCTRRET